MQVLNQQIKEAPTKNVYRCDAFLAPTLVSPSVSPFIGDTFGFPFCQHLWALTKRQDNIVVADMVADTAADMEVYMVADMEVDKVVAMFKTKCIKPEMF